MVPTPKKQNPQRQKITTALRKVCQDYPGGAVVLRELLQNADDAGASQVSFVLDTDTYRSRPLLSAGLAAYQGPALLAHNDATFTDSDFESLGSLGDSLKRQDPSTTGKFGLGFSSVYNWTDCPTVLSRSTLLLLDPHESWSSFCSPPGGPMYDIPENAHEEAMQNQLLPFQRINKQWKTPFDGTIIRVPLRTAAQARESDISKSQTTVQDIITSLNKFSAEMSANGLLFLKSVRRISFTIDDAEPEVVEVVNHQSIERPVSTLKMSLKKMLSTIHDTRNVTAESVYYQVHLRNSHSGKTSTRKFGVLHLIAGPPTEPKLARWAVENKHFPWVAVAAPLGDTPDLQNSGGVFTVLPLPIKTSFPIHVHGLFAVAADRSSFRRQNDSGVLETHPQDWNNFIARKLVPTAWAKLLDQVAKSDAGPRGFDIWPRPLFPGNSLWQETCQTVLDLVAQTKLKIWPTRTGFVALEDGLVAPEDIKPSLATAIYWTKAPVIYVPRILLAHVHCVKNAVRLSPKSLLRTMKAKTLTSDFPSQARLDLLEYFLESLTLQEVAYLDLFPFNDGTFKKLTMAQISFLNRDENEDTLFNRQRSRSIKLDKLSTIVKKGFVQHAESNRSLLRYRTIADCSEYLTKAVGQTRLDQSSFGIADEALIQEAWKWLPKHWQDGVLNGLLPLVPLQNGAFRSLVPGNPLAAAFMFSLEPARGLIAHLTSVCPSLASFVVKPPELLDPNPGLEFIKHLQYSSTKGHQVFVGNNVRGVIHFLSHARKQIASLPPDSKDRILATLNMLCMSENYKMTASDSSKLRQLALFKQILWSSETSEPSFQRTDLSSTKDILGMTRLVPIPPKAQRVLLHIDDANRFLFQATGFVAFPTETELVEQHIAPDLEEGAYCHLQHEAQTLASGLLLENFYKLSRKTMESLADLPIIPVKDQSGNHFAAPKDVIAPEKHVLRSLFFADDYLHPENTFYKRFASVLVQCGVSTALNENLAVDRIKAFSKRKNTDNSVARKCEAMLKLSPSTSPSSKLADVAQNNDWLPAKGPTGSYQFINSTQCRDKSSNLLVGRVLKILDFTVHSDWLPLLGWDGTHDIDLIMRQLEASTLECDERSTDQALSYLERHFNFEAYCQKLQAIPFVHCKSGVFALVSHVCKSGASKLDPYLFDVEASFWKRHMAVLVRMGVSDSTGPSVASLKNAQTRLEQKQPLKGVDIRLCIELSKIWKQEHGDAANEIKLPDQNGNLALTKDIMFNDQPCKTDYTGAVAHDAVPRDLADMLHLPLMSEKILQEEIGISDQDDDEFCQREDFIDVIRGTLERYTIESIFNEYLANADDCGTATEVNLMLDETEYSAKTCLSKGVEDLQGPALLIHNDGEFKEEDFDGLKHVGRGSKRNDPNTIGKFGRGHLTMYHFTQCPMILSGKNLLILDPLRERLPPNARTRKPKPGILLNYARIRDKFPDQLKPFDGLWGFDREKDHFPGTIFRFPLRKPGVDCELLEHTKGPSVDNTRKLLQNYFQQARESLLFIRNVNSIDFHVKGRVEPEWKVGRDRVSDVTPFQLVSIALKQKVESAKPPILATEKWLLGIEDVSNAPAALQLRHKRTSKYTECGFAVRLDKAGHSDLTSGEFSGRFFNCLPLKFETDLPVHVHGTFLLSGDRQSITTEETSAEDGAEWNKWLLKDGIGCFYLDFLAELGRRKPHDIYNFFPLPKSSGSLSALVASGFWEKLTTSSCQLFPIVEPIPLESGKDATPQKEKRRQASRLVQAESAVFCLEDKETSTGLMPLLSNYKRNVVDRPPAGIAAKLKNMEQINRINPSMVRDMIKPKLMHDVVRKIFKQFPGFLPALLSFIHEEGSELGVLHGCPIVPLESGDLGVLSAASGDKTSVSPIYFVADSRVKDLFPYAQCRFVKFPQSSLLFGKPYSTRVLEKLCSSGLFNLKTFTRKWLSEVLQDQSDVRAGQLVSQEVKKRLTRFWAYANESEPKIETLGADGKTLGADGNALKESEVDFDTLKSFPLLSVTAKGESRLQTLERFLEGNMLPNAEEETAKSVLSDFEGLEVVDRATLPTKYQTETLHEKDSMMRFLKAIRMLAVASGKPLGQYFAQRVRPETIKTLRQLLLTHFSVDKDVQESAKDVPLWKPVAHECSAQTATPTQYPLLTAKEGLRATEGLLVPWMKDYERFTAGGLELITPRIDDSTLLHEYVLPRLPESVSNKSKPAYAKLLSALALKYSWLSQATLYLLRQCKIAAPADSDWKLVKAATLFDHSDGVFRAAFRTQPSRFLAPELRGEMGFWRDMGIKHRSTRQYDANDYVEALTATSDRLESTADGEMDEDIKVILGPLVNDSSTVSHFNSSEWAQVAKKALFPVSSNPGGRQDYSTRQWTPSASQSDALSIRQIVKAEYYAVCWSQKTFPALEPSNLTFQRTKLSGRPTVTVVWEHLKFLAKLAPSLGWLDVEPFLEDLEASYGYLQQHFDPQRNSFNEHDAAIWLNVDTVDRKAVSTETLRTGWARLDRLILDSPCDASPLMRVRPFIGRYSTLLKAAGCESVYYPPVEAPQATATSDRFAGIAKLWAEDYATDVKLRADGTEMTAHRVVLANASEYMKRRFAGRWDRTGTVDADGRVIMEEEDLTATTLAALVSTCYGAPTAWEADTRVSGADSEAQCAAKLGALLDILQGADIWMMDELKARALRQVMSGCRYFVRPDNVADVELAAEEANAADLVLYCRSFRRGNARTVERARRSEAGG